MDPELIVPNPDLSIGEGAIAPWAGGRSQYYSRLVESAAEEHKVPLDKPWSKLTAKQRKVMEKLREREQARWLADHRRREQLRADEATARRAAQQAAFDAVI